MLPRILLKEQPALGLGLGHEGGSPAGLLGDLHHLHPHTLLSEHPGLGLGLGHRGCSPAGLLDHFTHLHPYLLLAELRCLGLSVGQGRGCPPRVPGEPGDTCGSLVLVPELTGRV